VAAWGDQVAERGLFRDMRRFGDEQGCFGQGEAGEQKSAVIELLLPADVFEKVSQEKTPRP
jgi:hypothetical protein